MKQEMERKVSGAVQEEMQNSEAIGTKDTNRAWLDGVMGVVTGDALGCPVQFMEREEIAGRVEVKGRGGTRLQPAVELLQCAKDFPKDGPILIITDGEIDDRLDIKRTHAYILPAGRRLPFRARGEVFYF